jgi:hypothetical protein
MVVHYAYLGGCAGRHEALLHEIAALYDGANNGLIKFGTTDAQRKLRTTRRRAEQALVDLNDIGLAEDRRDSSKRRLWSLAHLRCDATGRPALRPWDTKLTRRVDEHDARWWPWSAAEVTQVRRDCLRIYEANTCARWADRQYSVEFLLKLGDHVDAVDAEEMAERLNASGGGWMERFDHPPFGFHDRASKESKFSKEEQEAFDARLFKKSPGSLVEGEALAF